MSTNPLKQMVPFTTIKMLNESTKLIGLPRLKAQIVITLPNICEFNQELKESMDFSQEEIECFIITSSTDREIKTLINEYGLNESIISNDFKSYAKLHNLKNERNELIKSLIMINRDCQIIHKEIM